ncbi:MAG: GPI inositol-deacylase [Desulfobacterales bacterium]|nr:GPI inositol-deacylase [Desulfobacterales bacterium]
MREVMLVGHSMGGVVARVALAGDRRAHRARGAARRAEPAARSRRCWRCARVYPTVRKLAALDLRHDAEDLARIVFRTLPSLHELLPDPAPRAVATTCSTRRPGPTTRCGPDRTSCSPTLPRARARWPAADAALPAHRRRAAGDRHARGAARRRVPLRAGARRRRHGAAVARRAAGRTRTGSSARSTAGCRTTARSSPRWWTCCAHGSTERLPGIARGAAASRCGAG